jgi:hypothetical protein
MSGETNTVEPRRTRWLPAAVFSIFALVALADAVVIVLYGNYRNLIEEDGVEMAFTPADPSIAVARDEAVEVVDGCRIVTDDQTALVEVVEGRIRVLAPGALVLRFRAHDAGSFMEFDYRFRKRRSAARCNLTVARVASRYGVDYMCRESLVARKKAKGVFRQYLADHAGWFELTLEVNEAAAATGFEITKPEVVRDK